MTNPYESMGPEAFWKSAVATPGAHGLTGLWTPKYRIKPNYRIVTAGSCFAQHIGQALSGRDYNWTDCEAAPPFLSESEARRFGYGVFSFRTGNIYTPSMLLQWLELAYGAREEVREVWRKDGRFYDPLRPTIEPDGFASAEEVWTARQVTYAALRKAIETAHVFVFTLGLTERWHNTETNLEYAICPGTVAGTFDPDKHMFTNSGSLATYRALMRAMRFARSKNRKLKVLLTVSPVPLTATASGQHVLTATQYSKSVLRAAAGKAAEASNYIDYFPSLEIITHPIFRGMFFAPNMRSVVPEGVATVMRHFFADQARVFGENQTSTSSVVKEKLTMGAEIDVKCEEELLNAFAD